MQRGASPLQNHRCKFAIFHAEVDGMFADCMLDLVA